MKVRRNNLIGEVSAASYQVAAGNHIASPVAVSNTVHAQIVTVNVAGDHGTDEGSQEPSNSHLGTEIDFKETAKKTNEEITKSIPSTIIDKPMYARATFDAIEGYKRDPKLETFVIAAQYAQIIIKYANYFETDKIDNAFVFKTTYKDVQLGKAHIPLFIILTTRGLFPAVDEKLFKWGEEAFDWNKYVVTDKKFKIPTWINEDLQQAGTWDTELHNVIIQLGRLSYTPTTEKINSLIESFLQLKARGRILKKQPEEPLSASLVK